MAKNKTDILKDFIWFNSPGGGYSPSSMEDYVSGANAQIMPQSPREGSLSKLGKALSGVGAAFAGDTQWLQRQQKLDQEQYQADLEWKAALAKQQQDMKPTMSFNPLTGEYTYRGDVPKGTIVRNEALPLDYQLKKSELTGMATMLPKMDQAKEAVNMLKEQYYSAVSPQSVEKGDIKGGLKARASGLGEGLKAIAGASPDLKTFKNNRGAFASLISKGGFLEAGVLTNQDIDRVLAAVPDEYATEQEASKGWKTVDEILSASRKRYESGVASVSGNRKGNADGFLTTKSGIKFKVTK